MMIEGGCNCGAIRFRVAGEPLGVAACHCRRCRRQSGGACSINLLVAPASMTITGTPNVYTDTDTTSGLPVYREFCGACGSPIRSVMSANPEVVAVKAGTLDEPDGYPPDLHAFTRSKLAWVELPRTMPQFPANPA